MAPDGTFDLSALGRRLLARLFRYRMALQVTNLGTLIQFQPDKLLLAHFVGLAGVTHLELGHRLASAAWALPTLLLPPTVPAFSHPVAVADRERLLRLYQTATPVFATAFLLARFVAVSALALVTAWLGPGYRPIALATAALVAFLLFTTRTGVCAAALRGMERPWLEARYRVVAMAPHLALSLWLVPRAALAGALPAMGGSALVSVAYLVTSLFRTPGESRRRWVATLWPPPWCRRQPPCSPSYGAGLSGPRCRGTTR